MTSRHLKTTVFLEFRGEFEWPQFPKLGRWGAGFSQSFCPLVPLGSACGLVAAPEARHRCTSQPGTVTSRSLRGSSWPRRLWMRRTKMAVPSDEDWGISWGMGPLWGSGGNFDGSSLSFILFSLFMERVKTFAPTSAPLRIQTRCFLLTILAWQSFGATIAIQNWSQISIPVQRILTSFYQPDSLITEMCIALHLHCDSIQWLVILDLFFSSFAGFLDEIWIDDFEDPMITKEWVLQILWTASFASTSKR